MITSREQLLNAMRRQPVDHTPFLLRFWYLGGEEDHIPFNWRDEIARVENTLALGLDDTILLQPPLGYVEEYAAEPLPAVSSRVEVLISNEAGGQPLLKKIYETPEGPLQTTVVMTEDWPHGKDIHLFDDYNLSRLKEPLIKDAHDIQRLKYLLGEPGEEQLKEYQDRAAFLRDQAERLGVVLDGGWTALGDAVMWLCGMERVLYGQMDEPDFIDQVLEAVFQWELRRIDLLIREGIQVLVHMAWYESTKFWTPKNYRRMIKPRLKQFAEKAHQHGVLFRYIITSGWKPYWKDLLDIGVDCLTGIDPVQDQIDLGEIKDLLGSQVCLMGGLNSAVMLSQWSDEKIREAVDRAISVMAPGGGFILYPVDAIFNTQPWEKVLVMIDQWKSSWAA